MVDLVLVSTTESFYHVKQNYLCVSDKGEIFTAYPNYIGDDEWSFGGYHQYQLAELYEVNYVL
jgi:hypothetical protein